MIHAISDARNNAELVEQAASLYCPDPARQDWYVLDPTYGRGTMWKKWKPENLYIHRSDFTEPLRIYGREYDLIVFDPPYCVDYETEILTGRGWLRRPDLRGDDHALVLDHSTGFSRWEPLLSVVDFPAADRRMLSMESRSHSSLTTADHRWPVIQRRPDNRGWKTSETLRNDDRIPVRSPHAGAPNVATHSDALVELVAWFWTEGTLDRQRDGSLGTYGKVCQSSAVNPENCQRITAAFCAAFGPASVAFPRTGRSTDGIPRWRIAIDGHKTVWWFSSDLGAILDALAPGRVPTVDFLRSLTTSQLDQFIDISMRADGHTRKAGRQRLDGVTTFASTLGQKNPAAADAFQIALILAGFGSSTRTNGSMTTVSIRTEQTVRVGQQRPSWTTHDGPVWCVTTPTGTWMARRHGRIHWTGNCAKGGKATTAELADHDDRYGREARCDRKTSLTVAEVGRLMTLGMANCAAVLKPGGMLWVKSADFVTSGKIVWGNHLVRCHGRSLGLEHVDELYLRSNSPQPQVDLDGTPRRQVHARRGFSMLSIWRKARR